MNITIVVLFPGAETRTGIWAREENRINFRRDPDRAARCTASYAAVELKHYLGKTLSGSEIQFASTRPKNGFFIELQTLNRSSKDESFTLEPVGNGLVVNGSGRTGTLYGAYEILRMQGWRWLAPGPEGETTPEVRDRLVLPTEKKTYRPAFDLGRGFEFEGLSKDSVPLWIWMARNRLNLCASRLATAPLCEKLGMSPKIGGHIFEAILDPDRPMPSGKTLWEEHLDWFGLPADGVRKKESAQRIQFCVSQSDLMDFLAEELLGFLNGEWKDADRIDVWTFDTWGSTCQCDQCRDLGNSTDQLLHFLSALRERVNRARKDGRLDHDVQLVSCAYEGTCTLEGPTRPVPENLLKAKDYLIYSPINRCYVHEFMEPGCSWNRPYAHALQSWSARPPAMLLMVNEYYNVSKFEDLPLLFTRTIARDLRAYRAMGVRGMTYMHLPMVHWGMRTLTQVLYAELIWNTDADAAALIEEYFRIWYGPYADAMRKVYESVEEAWTHCSNWRAWSAKSVLTRLIGWDGARPAEPLPVDDHFGSVDGAIRSGRQSLTLMREALDLLDRVRTQDRETSARTAGGPVAQAVNPVEARRLENAQWYEKRLGEDRRLLVYGIDTMTIMTELAAYYDALQRKDDPAAGTIWKAVETAAEKLDAYLVPMTFDTPGPIFECRDALTRSQVRDLLRRGRKFRLETYGNL